MNSSSSSALLDIKPYNGSPPRFSYLQNGHDGSTSLLGLKSKRDEVCENAL